LFYDVILDSAFQRGQDGAIPLSFWGHRCFESHCRSG
jgi:hypothetical protein